MATHTLVFGIVEKWENQVQRAPLVVLNDLKIVRKARLSKLEAATVVTKLQHIRAINKLGSKPNAPTKELEPHSERLRPILEAFAYQPRTPGVPPRPPPEGIISFLAWNGWSPEDELKSLATRERVNRSIADLIVRVIDRSLD